MAARATAFRLESPAPARSTAAPAAPRAAAERARPPRIGRILGLPLTDHHLARIAELEQLVGERYRGWGREGLEAGRQPDGHWQESTWDLFFVDVHDEGDAVDATPIRYAGATLHQALGAAIRAARGQR